MKSVFIIVSLLTLFMFVPSTYAGDPCTVEMMRAMIEEGLSNDQIQSICDKAKLLQGSGAQAEEDIYAKAQRLYKEQQFSDMISLLRGHCEDNLYDMKANVLLAEAYLEQVEIMKNLGDKGYKELVNKPYLISRRFVSSQPDNPDGLYLAGRSFVLNERATRGLKYIKKAIKISNKEVCEYYITFGDAILDVVAYHGGGAMAAGSEYDRYDAISAYEKAIELAQIDWLKEKAQKRLDAIK